MKTQVPTHLQYIQRVFCFCPLGIRSFNCVPVLRLYACHRINKISNNPLWVQCARVRYWCAREPTTNMLPVHLTENVHRRLQLSLGWMVGVHEHLAHAPQHLHQKSKFPTLEILKTLQKSSDLKYRKQLLHPKFTRTKIIPPSSTCQDWSFLQIIKIMQEEIIHFNRIHLWYAQRDETTVNWEGSHMN